jgi:hypothetical protein
LLQRFDPGAIGARHCGQFFTAAAGAALASGFLDRLASQLPSFDIALPSAAGGGAGGGGATLSFTAGAAAGGVGLR